MENENETTLRTRREVSAFIRRETRMLERLDYTKSEINRVAWENLLSASGLRPDPPYTAVYGVFRDDQLVATGARDGARIKCVAVRHDYRGGTVFHELLSGMIMEALDAGINRLFLYTTPDAVQAFEQLGFRVLARIDNGISFMERGTPTIDDYTRRLREQLDRYQEKNGVTSDPVESIVMNANPFTKGHRALIEDALSRSGRLHLFILSEDASSVPADTRRTLVMEGTADLAGIIYHPTDSYIISRASFPSYFLKKESETTETQARLDAVLFRDRIAPALGITHRTVGDETDDPVTALYNDCLAREFKDSLNLTVMPRVQAEDGKSISASRVRQLLLEGKLDEIAPLVPSTTFQYFKSPEGQELVRSWAK
jgi:[citrate (pro-3S)-lyase] ligase